MDGPPAVRAEGHASDLVVSRHDVEVDPTLAVADESRDRVEGDLDRVALHQEQRDFESAQDRIPGRLGDQAGPPAGRLDPAFDLGRQGAEAVEPLGPDRVGVGHFRGSVGLGLGRHPGFLLDRRGVAGPIRDCAIVRFGAAILGLGRQEDCKVPPL